MTARLVLDLVAWIGAASGEHGTPLAWGNLILEKTLAVNLESVVWMCQEFIRRRLKEGGVIVNVSSIEAVLPFKEDMIPVQGALVPVDGGFLSS